VCSTRSIAQECTNTAGLSEFFRPWAANLFDAGA
jgi:hypothetical protein